METDRAVETFSKNAVINFFGALWQFGLILIGTRVVIDILGAEAYGLLALVGGVSGYFLYLEIGMAETIVKKVSEAASDEERSKTVSTLFFLSIGIGIFISIMIALFSMFGLELLFPFPPDLMADFKNIFYIIAAGTIFFYPLNVFSKVFIGLHRFDVYNILRVGYQTAILIGIVLAIKNTNSVVSAVAVITVGGIIWKANSLILLRKLYPGINVSAKLYDTERVKDLLRYKSYAFLAQGSGHAIFQGGLYVVGIMLSPAMVALYSVANVIATKVAELAGVLGTALFPLLSTLYGADKTVQIKKAFVLGTLLIAVSLLPVAAFFYANAETIARLWIGSGFIEAGPVMQILCVAWYMNICSMVAALSAKAVNRPDIDAKWAFAIAVINITLDFLVIGPYGITGVVYATLLCQSAGSMVLIFLIGREIGADLVSLFKMILPVFAAGVLFMPVYSVPLPMFLFFLRPVVHSSLLFAVFYFFIIDKENRDYLKNMAGIVAGRIRPLSSGTTEGSS
jgi:O-antigen/teichoic acid export membrane protein